MQQISQAKRHSYARGPSRLASLLTSVSMRVHLRFQLHSADESAAPADRVNPSAPRPMNWPVFRGDALAQGVARCELPEKPELLWKQSFTRAAFEATAVIADGMIYVGTNNDDATGDFYALDLADGKEKWKFQDRHRLHRRAAIRDGRDLRRRLRRPLLLLQCRRRQSALGFTADAAIHGGAEFLSRQSALRLGRRHALLPQRGRRQAGLGIHDRSAAVLQPDGRRESGVSRRLRSAFHIVDLETGKAVASIDIDAQTGNARRCSATASSSARGSAACLRHRLERSRRSPGPSALRVASKNTNRRPRSQAASSCSAATIAKSAASTPQAAPKSGASPRKATSNRRRSSSAIALRYVGSNDGRFYGRRSGRRREVWEYEAGAAIVASPAVADQPHGHRQHQRRTVLLRGESVTIEQKAVGR